jgi:hypothetical protein
MGESAVNFLFEIRRLAEGENKDVEESKGIFGGGAGATARDAAMGKNAGGNRIPQRK